MAPNGNQVVDDFRQSIVEEYTAAKTALGAGLAQIYQARWQGTGDSYGLTWGRSFKFERPEKQGDPERQGDPQEPCTPGQPEERGELAFRSPRVVNTSEALMALSNISLSSGLGDQLIENLEEITQSSIAGLHRNMRSGGYLSLTAKQATIRASALPVHAACALLKNARRTASKNKLLEIAQSCGAALTRYLVTKSYSSPQLIERDQLFGRVFALRALVQAAALLESNQWTAPWMSGVIDHASEYFAEFRKVFANEAIAKPGILARSLDVLQYCRTHKQENSKISVLAEHLTEQTAIRLLTYLDSPASPSETYMFSDLGELHAWLDLSEAWALEGLAVCHRNHRVFSQNELRIIMRRLKNLRMSVLPKAYSLKRFENPIDALKQFHGPFFGAPELDELGHEHKIYHAALYCFAVGECINMLEDAASQTFVQHSPCRNRSPSFLESTITKASELLRRGGMRVYNTFEALDVLSTAESRIDQAEFLNGLRNFITSDFEEPTRFNLIRHIATVPGLCRHAHDCDAANANFWRDREREALLLLVASQNVNGSWSYAPAAPTRIDEELQLLWDGSGITRRLDETLAAMANHHANSDNPIVKSNALAQSTIWTAHCILSLLGYLHNTLWNTSCTAQFRACVTRGLEFLVGLSAETTTLRPAWSFGSQDSPVGVSTSALALRALLAAESQGITIQSKFKYALGKACTEFLSQEFAHVTWNRTEDDDRDCFALNENDYFSHLPLYHLIMCHIEYHGWAKSKAGAGCEGLESDLRNTVEERYATRLRVLNRELEVERVWIFWRRKQYAQIIAELRRDLSLRDSTYDTRRIIGKTIRNLEVPRVASDTPNESGFPSETTLVLPEQQKSVNSTSSSGAEPSIGAKSQRESDNGQVSTASITPHSTAPLAVPPRSPRDNVTAAWIGAIATLLVTIVKAVLERFLQRK